jgi:Family of unknown function (DUF5832)
MGSLEPDYLTIPGQLFACVSFVGPDQPQKNELLGMKIRGCFPTRDEAASHAKRLQKEDGLVDIYVVDMYKWLLIPPTRENIENVHYANEKLEEIMTKYRENQSQAASMFEKRKRDMMAKPLEGPYPYADPADENSVYYNRPDVPPIPHPAEIFEQLKAEFPDKDEEVLRRMAAAEVSLEIAKRKKEDDERRAAAAANPELQSKVTKDGDPSLPLNEVTTPIKF